MLLLSADDVEIVNDKNGCGLGRGHAKTCPSSDCDLLGTSPAATFRAVWKHKKTHSLHIPAVALEDQCGVAAFDVGAILVLLGKCFDDAMQICVAVAVVANLLQADDAGLTMHS